MKLMSLRMLAVVALLIGCASGGAQNSAGGSRDVITQEQLAATNSGSLYDAVEKLRPEWLTSRGPTSVTNAAPTVASVFMNGQNLGKVDFLREIRVADVTEVRYWSAGQAAAKFGMGHPRGVIEITRR